MDQYRSGEFYFSPSKQSERDVHPPPAEQHSPPFRRINSGPISDHGQLAA